MSSSTPGGNVSFGASETNTYHDSNSSSSNDDEIQVFVTSCNLGNARPDMESIAAWLPADGRCLDVLKHPQQYPLQMIREEESKQQEKQEEEENESTNDDTDTLSPLPPPSTPPRQADNNTSMEEEEEEDQQFDIIVIGMQEATFGPPKKNGNTKNGKKATPSKQTSHQSSIDAESTNSVNISSNNDDDDDCNKDTGAVSEAAAAGTAGEQQQREDSSEHPQPQPAEDDTTTLRDDDQGNGNNNNNNTKPCSFSNRDSLVHFNIPIVTPVRRKITEGMKQGMRGVSGLTGNQDYTKQKGNKSPQSRLGSMIWTSLDIDINDWDFGTEYLHKVIQSQLPSYSPIVSFRRGEMRLQIYVRSDDVSLDVQVLSVAAQNTGRAGLANKGGIVAELLVNGRTKLAFVTCHLEAHEGHAKYQARCSSTSTILDGTRPPFQGGKGIHDVVVSSHYSWWTGDLNFRTEMPAEQYEDENDHKAKVRQLTSHKNWYALNDIDELHRALRTKDCLVGFQTPICNFPPTFKVERKSGFEYIEKRRPSYTDRILWKNGHQLKPVKPLLYESVDGYIASDHKPVRGAYAVPLNKPLRMRPRLTRRQQLRPGLSGFFPISRRGKLRTSFRSNSSRSRRGIRGGKVRFATGSAKSNTAPDKLYLFVSQLKCTINVNANGTKRSNAIAPNPFVALVTYPEEAVKKPMSFWAKVKSKARISYVSSKKRLDGSHERTAMGWPRSSVKVQAYEPDWGDEEILIRVRTHNEKDGMPIDLTGSMLKITVIDHDTTTTVRVGTDDPIIGTFSFNLASLLRRCIRRDGCAEDSSTSRRRQDPSSLTATSPAGGEGKGSSEGTKRKSSSRRGSTILQSVFHLGSKSKEDDKEDDDDEDEDPIVSADIDEPLVKNGKEVGRIQCTVDAWWMDYETTKSIRAAAAMPSSRQHKDKKASNRSRRSAISSNKNKNGRESGGVLLSGRRLPQSQRAHHSHHHQDSETPHKKRSWLTGVR